MAAQQLIKKFPNGIGKGMYGDGGRYNSPILEKFTIDHVLSVKDLLKDIEITAEFKSKNSEKRKEFLILIKKSLENLDKILPLFDLEDNIIKIHKESDSKALLIDKYEEVDQKSLEKFIKKKAPNLLSDSISMEDIKNAYNAQFRLQIYEKRLGYNNTIINYDKLLDDLEWTDFLTTKLQSNIKMKKQITFI
jgi:hypothetical protein